MNRMQSLIVAALLAAAPLNAQSPEVEAPSVASSTPSTAAYAAAARDAAAWREALEALRAAPAATSLDPATSTGVTTPATIPLPADDLAGYLHEREELVRGHIADLESLSTQLKAVPLPDEDLVGFVQAREAIQEMLERKQREATLAAERATVDASHGDLAAARLAGHRARLAGRLSEVLTQAMTRAQALWEEAFPDEEARTEAEAAARQALVKAREDAEEAARTKAAQSAEQLEKAREEAEQLAAKARDKAERASSELEVEVAQVLKGLAELTESAAKYSSMANKAEVAGREAERELERLRAELSARLPELLRPQAKAADALAARQEWTAQAARLAERAKLLQGEIDVEREQVPTIQSRAQQLGDRYDELDAGLEDNRANARYRELVYFSRRAHRQASASLDRYRTYVEWREREQKALERSAAALEDHAAKLTVVVQQTFAGQTAEQWTRFLLTLGFAIFLSFIVDLLFRGIFKAFTAKTSWTWDDVAIAELRSPVRVLVVLAGAFFAFRAFTLPHAGKAVLWRWGEAAGTIWVGFLAWRLQNIVVKVAAPRISKSESKLDDQLLRFLGRGMRFVIAFITGVYVLEAFGWKVTSVLAGLGIGGLAFALAAKDTLANLFGSIMLFADRPFQVGNWVIVGGVEGIVEDIGIRSTRIRTFKDTVVTLPNATVANSSAENVHSFRKRRLYFTIELRLDTPPDKMKATVDMMRDVLEEHPMVLDGHYVYLTGIKASGVEIMVYSFVATRDWREWMHHAQDIYLEVLTKLADMGVEMAYPTQTLVHERGLPHLPVGFSQVGFEGQPLPGSLAAEGPAPQGVAGK